MDSSRSQTKVLFAYQLKERNAARENPTLDLASNNITVRVVQYLNVGAYFNDSEFDEASQGRGSLKTDFLSSAILTKYTNTANNALKLTTVEEFEPGAILKIAPCLYKNYRIVDIVLSSNSTLTASVNTSGASSVYGVLIGLQFDSGATDDLFLTLIKNPICNIDLDSENTRNAANVVGPLVDSGYGGVGSIEINTGGFEGGSADDTYFSAFSWAKYYKVARAAGGLGTPGCLQKNETDFNPTHTQFYTGWGYTSSITQSGPSSQQWAVSNGYFASPTINIAPWVSGRADLTKSFLEKGADLETAEETQCNVENNPLGRFFGISAPLKGERHVQPGTGATNFTHDNPQTSWGQHFGWLTTPPGFVVKDSEGNILTSSRVWGTPPAFTAAVNPGITHSGISASQALPNPDTDYYSYTELSKSWFGAFPSDYQSYMEAGDSGLTTNTPITPYLGTSTTSNPATGSSSTNRDPVRRRFNRFWYRPAGQYTGSNGSGFNFGWYASGFYGGTDTTQTELNYASKLRSNSTFGGATSFYPRVTNREYAASGYAWINCSGSSSLWSPNSGDLGRSGSLRGVRATRGVNFFYTGATEIDSEVYSPVFKGHGKVIKLLRASGFGSANISGLVYQVASQHLADNIYNDNIGFHDLRSYIEACSNPTGADPDKKFNGIDLLFNLIYRDYGYPDDLRAYGRGTEQFFHQNGLLADIVTSTYNGGGDLSTSPVTFEGTSNGNLPLQASVQDIAYLVEGFNRVNVPSTTDYTIAAYALNHPLESAWSDNDIIPASPDNIYIDLEPSKHRPFQIGPGQVSLLAENPSLNAKAIYSAAPVGGNSNGGFGAPPLGNSSNFAHTYTNTSGGVGVYEFGSSSEDYPDGTSGLGGRQLHLPHIDPALSEHRKSIIKNSVGTAIIEILSQAVLVRNMSGTGNEVGFPQASPNNQNLQIDFVLRYQYSDPNTTHFQTGAGDRTVTEAAVPVLATRVTKVLEVWNHIEIIPLSRLSEDGAVNSFGVNGEPSFAYRQAITSADHVDNISIVQIFGEGDHVYELRVTLRADEDDVYNNPDYVLGAEDQPFTAIVPDVPYDNSGDYRAGTTSAWSTGYAASDTDPDNGSSKASFIVVAHASTWENTPDVAASNVVALGPTNTTYVLQTPYVTYGGFSTPDVSPFEEVFGCTDSTALNFNPEANADDGSCQFCDDVLLDTFNNYSIDSGWNVGAFKNGSDNIFNGLVAGEGISYNDSLPANFAGIPYIGSNEMKRGGTVMCNNAFIGENALCNLSIKGQSHAGIDNFTAALDLITNNYGEGPDSCWRLKIYPMTDEISANVTFTSGSSIQDIINADNAPDLSSSSAIYNAYANGGTLQNPEWKLIANENTVALGGNLKAGNGYLLEMIFDPSKLDGTDCASFLTKDFRMYGMFWTGFCSCASLDNDYYTTALNNNGYQWNSSYNFPVLPYADNSKCPDAIPGNLLDDGPYFGTSPGAANATICFQNDDELVNCDTYFLSCVVGPNIICDTLVDVQNGTATPIDLGGGQFQLGFTGSIEVNLEGVYSSQANQLIVTDDIQYNVNVTGPGGYSEQQNEGDTEYSASNPFYINIFDNITVAGEYTVEVQLTAPYPDGIQPVGYPCTDVFTVLIENTCGTYIEGCTDPTADNFDPNATVPNGTCTFTDPCEDVYLNASFESFTATPTNSDSSCGTDTIVFEGQSYDINAPLPLNNGTVTANVTYESNEGAVSAYAIALVAQGVPFIGNLDNVTEVFAAVFANYPTALDVGGVDLTGNAGSQIAFWSPLFPIATTSNPNNFTFTGIAPGSYYVLVVPDIQAESLDPAYLQCAEAPFLKFEDYLTSVYVGQNAAPDCEEECLNPPMDVPTPSQTITTLMQTLTMVHVLMMRHSAKSSRMTHYAMTALQQTRRVGHRQEV